MMLSSVLHGFKLARRNKRMIFVLYLMNLIFGLMIALPFRAALIAYGGNSLMGEKLAGRMDMDFAFEFIAKNGTAFSSIAALMIIAAALYWIFNLFLSGGAFAILVGAGTY